MNQPSTYPRVPRRFNCLKCGCEVYRPESDRLDNWICLNCLFGRVRSEQT
jgi:hypothetical protein